MTGATGSDAAGTDAAAPDVVGTDVAGTDGNALGTFLRARREAAAPETLGLPNGPRRRTPGLRRSELAHLAGVSVEYLTRLERGADRNPSPQVLAALAKALELGADEHVHLLRLVKGGDGPCTAQRPPLRPTVVALLRAVAGTPAAVLDRTGAVLARNDEFAVLYPPDVDNLPRFVFTDPRAPELLPDREAIADEWAVRLRAAADLGDGTARALATDLAAAAPEGFAARYARATRIPAWTGTERRTGPEGPQTWRYEALEIPETDEHRLVVYLPM
ncbi:Helix-turn-helix domain-containing protein [Prauserella aidingensis]|uniref:helix-turn-helix domain-containing protein n=1 Tax=Prauserella aidingensis TaxID=387890 RepID=UPI0020A2A926|nr:helix-turn-helix domain-containing protein [Prauserella aidingensis]MCP2253656.1 Helix-turn-helix domain-containing protein [Prauserella aidingensis]